MSRGRPPHPELLTPREQEVLDLLREGLTNQEIAGRLGISRAGAAYHVGEILSKLDVSTRRDAAALEPKLVRRRVWGLAGLGGFLSKAPTGSIMKLSGIAAIAGGIGLVVLLAIGAGITKLRSDASADLDCVTGEAAVNDVGAGGEENLRQEFLSTIGEAEAFLCVDLPSIDLPSPWRKRNFITAVRSNSLAQFEPGEWTADEDPGIHLSTECPRRYCCDVCAIARDLLIRGMREAR